MEQTPNLSPRPGSPAVTARVIAFPMPGPTLQDRLNILLEHLAEAERDYAAGVPYPDRAGGSWPEKIAVIKKRIATVREMIANE